MYAPRPPCPVGAHTAVSIPLPSWPPPHRTLLTTMCQQRCFVHAAHYKGHYKGRPSALCSMLGAKNTLPVHDGPSSGLSSSLDCDKTVCRLRARTAMCTVCSLLIAMAKSQKRRATRLRRTNIHLATSVMYDAWMMQPPKGRTYRHASVKRRGLTQLSPLSAPAHPLPCRQSPFGLVPASVWLTSTVSGCVRPAI